MSFGKRSVAHPLAERQEKFESILEAQRHHQLRPQPEPPAPSAPIGAPKDPKPFEPEGGGDPGDPKVKEEDKPQEPPSKPPGLPLEPEVIRVQPQAKDGPEAKEEPRQRKSQRQRTSQSCPTTRLGRTSGPGLPRWTLKSHLPNGLPDPKQSD